MSNAIFGLQSMDSHDPMVCTYINNITKRSRNSGSNLDPQGLANSLYALQGCHSKHFEVKELLKLIVQKAEGDERMVLTSQGVGNALFGLRNMENDVPQVRFLTVTQTLTLIGNRDI